MIQSTSQELLPAAPAQTSEHIGVIRWLIDPLPRRFLLPLTGLWILGLDWLLFSPEAATLGMTTPLLAVLGFLIGSTGTFHFQRRFAGDTRAAASLKALLAGLVVGVPLPLAGTIVGTWVLATSGLTSLKDRLLRK